MQLLFYMPEYLMMLIMPKLVQIYWCFTKTIIRCGLLNSRMIRRCIIDHGCKAEFPIKVKISALIWDILILEKESEQRFISDIENKTTTKTLPPLSSSLLSPPLCIRKVCASSTGKALGSAKRPLYTLRKKIIH
jgi:hypothetical protein